MSATSRTNILQDMAAGKAVYILSDSQATATVSTANAAAGHFSISISPWSFSSAALVDFPDSLPIPAGLPDSYFLGSIIGNAFTTRNTYFARIYLVGSLNLAATGDQFTHNAATYPLTRTIMGQATQPVAMIPLIRIKTALSATAAVIRLRTAAGGAGYVDQDGNNVVGTKTITMPSPTTAAESCYIFKLETGDTGVRDISAIEVTTASSTGTADVCLLEIISPALSLTISPCITDCLMNGFMRRVNPAVATSGTVPSALVVANFSGSNNPTNVFAYGVRA